MSEMIVVGKIAGVFGVQGWCKVFSHTSPRENILQYSPWYLKRDGEWQSIKVKQGRKQGKGIVAKLESINDRDDAAALNGIEIAIKQSQLPDLPKDEYYWSDLIGLEVETVTGVQLGKVAEMMATGANDVLIIKGDQEILIPFLQPDVVTEVDIKAGLIKVDWDPEF
ncbi:MAG: ribosome maturation factor RimM [Sulfuriflexus sp.]|nr:ribosome maturation factor RimM [Sulfuriflexus sp.]